jgi:hypothetical protein
MVLSIVTQLNCVPIDHGTLQNSQAYLHAVDEQGISLKQAIDGFLLTCKVEGKS